ncbi:methylaspartate mutase subunit E [Actinocorallia sp. B10E7]|uniref:methylaspartate mutase subunit E n=1 Tax=Actinocorallia sp. B10E7 TaxID=3153558 RepID=UPI00325E9040
MTALAARSARELVLAGVGGDAHSVGLITLARSLAGAGYRVRYLATQNALAELCSGAVGADAVLVSNMDGHARYYLADLPHFQDLYGVAGLPWFLGGNPMITADEEGVEELRRLGFRRVFPGYVDPAEVVAMLDAELAAGPGGGPGELTRPARRGGGAGVPRADPLAERQLVLSRWATGAEAADLDGNARSLLGSTWLSDVQAQAAAEGRVLIHPRTGVAGVGEQLELFHGLREAGADVLSLQIDSLTRNNAYEEAEAAIKEWSARGEGGGLNGYPAVNHGVVALRGFSGELEGTPLQVRHSTRDPRLLAEISFAGGVAAFEGGPITYNLPYYRDYDPREALSRWRYVDALAGTYRERFGIVIDREFFGVLTASLVPPCLALAADVLEALLAAAEGVRSVSLGYAEQGNRVQDVAAVRALRRTAERYLAEHFGEEVAVHTVFHQYMGAFPLSEEKSRELIEGSAVTALLSGATRLMLKTHVEAVRIPTLDDNIASLRLVERALAGPAGQEPSWDAVAAEEELIVRETVAIVDAVLAAGGGRVAEGVVRAVEDGLLDIPFSPSLWNRGQALCARDENGAVRFADAGRIPLPPDVLAHHRSLVEARRRRGRRSVEELVLEDVLSVARGRFDTWPLG